MKMNIAGLLALGNFMPLAPRVEEVALRGRMRSKPARSNGGRSVRSALSNAISSCSRRLGLSRLPERQVSSKAASQPLNAAASCCQPSRAFVCKNRGAWSKAARVPPWLEPPADDAAFQQCGWRLVFAGNAHPESLFLRGIEQQAGVVAAVLAGSAFQPRGAGKTLPIENLRRGPRS